MRDIMKPHDLAAHLKILEWRDDQLQSVSDQLDAALPELLNEVAEHVESAGILNSVKVSPLLERATIASLRRWSDEQAQIAARRAEVSLDSALTSLGPLHTVNISTRDAMIAGLGAGSGIALISASVLAVPSAVGFATIMAGGVLGFFATPVLSWSLLAVGGAALGASALTGSTLLDKAQRFAKGRLNARMRSAIEAQVMGCGKGADERSVRSDIQALVLAAGKTRIERLA